ncbi:hypothetical protein FRC15_007457 [Serendipita sp. 397]|nr:hypothetical protein FRC15_007457 [Serendipita sp. 397]
MYASRLLSFTFIFLHAGPLLGLDRSFTNKYCESILIIGGYGALLSFAMSNWILLARTRALLGRKRSYDAILILYFLLSYGIASVLVVASTTPLICTSLYSSLDVGLPPTVPLEFSDYLLLATRSHLWDC